MKQYKIIQAYKATEDLSNCAITKKEQWAVYQLRYFLRPHIEFQTEQEESLRKKYSEFADENGKLSQEKVPEYIADLNEIGNLEIELDEWTKPKIAFTDGITYKITEPLEDFFEFLPPSEE